MQIVDNLLVQRMVDVTKSVVVSFHETTIRTVDQIVLVWWKGGFHRQRTAEIGDGMELILAHRRPNIVYQLDPSWCLRGMAIYEEYNEKTDTHTSYLYGHTKDQEDIALLNDLMKGLHLSASVSVEGRYVALSGNIPPHLEGENLERALRMGRGKAMASYLFGCALGYGDVIFDEAIHQVRIQIPIIGSIVQQLPLLDLIRNAYEEIGVYITQKTLPHAQGELYEMTIADPELLLSFAKWYGVLGGTLPVAGFERTQSIKEQLMSFLTSKAIDSEHIEAIDYSVIKLLKK